MATPLSYLLIVSSRSALRDEVRGALRCVAETSVSTNLQVEQIAKIGEVPEYLKRFKAQCLVIEEGSGKDQPDLAQFIADVQVPVLILSGLAVETLSQQLIQDGSTHYLPAPASVGALRSAILNLHHSSAIIQNLQAKLSELQETLELRKLVERAKGILMEQQGFTEEDAHRTLQKLSQEQGVTLKEFCRSLIQVKMVLGLKRVRTAPRRTA